MLHIKSVKHISEYKLWLAFDNGTTGQVDLEGQLNGPVFEPLRDPHFFARVTVDPELETVVWPNWADLAPEYLLDLLGKQSDSQSTHNS